MAYNKNKKDSKKSDLSSSGKKMVKAGESRISEYNTEYKRWLGVLETYHSNRFNRNYKQYTSYTQTKETDTRISDPVAPELVEKVVQKMFEKDPKFFSLARGKTLPREVTDIMASSAYYYWTAPERIAGSGTMRAKMKSLGREFCVTGNVVVETFYNQKSETPDMRILPIEDVIFNPTKTLKSSERYYIRQYVSLDYLEDKKEVTENGKVVSGIFEKKAIDAIKRKYKDSPGFTQDPNGNNINRSGSDAYEKPVEKILLITIWEGKHCVRIADWEQIVQEYDNEILDDHPLDFATDIEVPKEPYAFSFLDFINGLTHAKDLLINQTVDYGTKLLNPPLFVDPTVSPVNKATLSNAYRAGGIVFATAKQAQHQPMPALPQAGFQLLSYLQQRSESVSGIGAYLSGVPNQESDKTRGTKGGILALMAQAVTPVKDRQLNIEESIIEPMVNKWLKYAGALMSANEDKYILITGSEPRWVQVTKGLLTGKIKLEDLYVAEIIDDEDLEFMVQELLEQGKDPETEIVIDTDWIVRVETGSLAEIDTEQELENLQSWAKFAIEMGQQIDTKKVARGSIKSKYKGA